jgi:hypothetical protein
LPAGRGDDGRGGAGRVADRAHARAAGDGDPAGCDGRECLNAVGEDGCSGAEGDESADDLCHVVDVVCDPPNVVCDSSNVVYGSIIIVVCSSANGDGEKCNGSGSNTGPTDGGVNGVGRVEGEQEIGRNLTLP